MAKINKVAQKKMTVSEKKAFKQGISLGYKSAKQQKTTAPKKAKTNLNPFAGADDVYFSKNSIAVTKVSTDKKGVLRERTKYLPRTERNVVMATRIHGGNIRIGK